MDPVQEALGKRWFESPFVEKARTIAAKLGVPVEWLLAAMSLETSHYRAYRGLTRLIPTVGCTGQ
jgi:hypothetical protein